MNEGFFGQLISALKPKKLSDQITFLGPVEDTIADQVIVTDPNDPINDQIRITDPEQQALEDQIVVKPASENEMQQIPPEQLLVDVSILEHASNPIEALVRILDENPQLAANNEVMTRLAVSAQSNKDAADTFMRTLRTVTNELLGEKSDRQYDAQTWYNSIDLNSLAERWQVPLALVVVGGNHYTLLLRKPEQHEGNWRALIYDPQRGGEMYVALPNWKPGLDFTETFAAGIACSTLGYQELQEGSYDLSLYGDEAFANHSTQGDAKRTRVQFDGWNCGPACLFMAMLRTGAQPEWNGFKFSGKDQLQQDTGLRVLTREEMV